MIHKWDIKIVHVGDLVHDQFCGRASVIDITNQMNIVGRTLQARAFAVDDLRENPAFAMGVGDEEHTASFIGLLQKVLRSARFSFHAFLLFESVNTLVFPLVYRQARTSASLKFRQRPPWARSLGASSLILMQSSTAPTPRRPLRSAVLRRYVRRANALSVASTSATPASPPFNRVIKRCSPANKKAERHCHSAFNAILIAL